MRRVSGRRRHPLVVHSTNHARADVPDCEDAVYDPPLLSRRFRLPTYVRLWLKRTFTHTVIYVCFAPESGHREGGRCMSAFDP